MTLKSSWPGCGSTQLSEDAHEYLEKRGITESYAELAGYRCLRPPETELVLGFRVPALAAPYPPVKVGEDLNFGRARNLADNPDLKFIQGKGTGNHLYMAPIPNKYGIKPNDVRKDRRLKTYICEGEFKAGRAAQDGLPVIAVSGAWSWSQDHQLILDFDQILMDKERDIVLSFDADAETNLHVQKGLLGLATKLLKERGAHVLIKLIPNLGDGRTGVDDFLVAKGKKAFLALPELELDDPKFRDWGIHPIVRELNEKHAVVILSGKTAVLSEVPDKLIKDSVKVEYSTVQDLHLWYANRKIESGIKKNGEPRFELASQLWLSSEERRQYQGVVMAPHQDVPGHFNLWRGWTVKPVKPAKSHSWSLLKQHIQEVVASGDKTTARWIFAFMADAIQNTQRPAGVSAVLQGIQGSGKGIVWTSLGHLFGRHFVQVSDPRHLVGNFNSHLEDKILIFCDEAFYAGDRAHAAVLKAMITEDTVMIEHKGVNAFTINNLRRVVFASNNDWVIPAGVEERRFAVFTVKPDHAQDRVYFDKIIHELRNGGYEALLYDLMHFDLSTVDLYKLPSTNALWQQKQLSWNDATAFWFSCLLNSEVPPGSLQWGYGNSGEVAKDTLLDAFKGSAKNNHDSGRVLEVKFGMAIHKLCREVLDNCRVSIKVRTDRPWGYRFPTLTRSRQLFEEEIRARINWETGKIKGPL